jgi:hypothetical protein
MGRLAVPILEINMIWGIAEGHATLEKFTWGVIMYDYGISIGVAVRVLVSVFLAFDFDLVRRLYILRGAYNRHLNGNHYDLEYSNDNFSSFITRHGPRGSRSI